MVQEAEADPNVGAWDAEGLRGSCRGWGRGVRLSGGLEGQGCGKTVGGGTGTGGKGGGAEPCRDPPGEPRHPGVGGEVGPGEFVGGLGQGVEGH